MSGTHCSSSKASLADAVSQAEMREQKEAHLAGLKPPSHYLGGPPEPWEVAIGDTTKRVALQGRSVIDYAAKMKAMGINERSMVGEINPVADHVSSMGREKMRLLYGQRVSALKTEALRGPRGDDDVGTFMEEERSISSGDLSEDSDEDVDDESENKAGQDNRGSTSSGKESPGKPSDELGLLGDTDIKNAVEDFDSSNWTLDQLEVSCQTLLQECYTSDDRRRRILSAGMLLKLIETYPSANRWMQRNLEAVVNDGLPSMIKGSLGTRVFKLDILLGILAPCLAESMTQLNVMARILRLMVFKMDTAMRLIYFRYTLPKMLENYRKLPPTISTHKCMTLLMQGSSLRSRWRNINADAKNGSLPPDLLHAYLCVILALVDKDTCPMYFRMNRVKMVGGGGLLALAIHFKDEDRSQRLACRILRELAREPLLVYELVKAGLARHLARLVPTCKRREIPMDKLLEALDALDSMAFSAMRYFIIKSEAGGDNGRGMSAVVAALVADGSNIGGLESEIRLPGGDQVEEIVKEQLGLSQVMTSLIGLLEETNVQLYLAGVTILGKLASTVCYHGVLQELLAYAGRALERLVQGIQSQEEIVPDMSLALFLQLCSRQEGRDGIEASDGAVMLRPIISGRHAQGSQPFLRGLACAVALSRRGNPEAASSSLSDASTRLGVPRSGGVGLSGPARPHQLDLASKLYVDLVETLDAAPLAPLDSVRALVRMEFLEPVVRFLVPEDDHDVRDGNSSGRTDSKSTSGGGNDLCDLVGGPHYFRLKQRHACLGAIALHGLVVLAGPHPALFTGRTLRYLCYSIQVAYFDLTVGRLAPGVGYPLVFRSIQLACRALAFLATSDVATMKVSRDEHEQEGKSELFGEEQEHMAARYGAPRRVVDCLLSTSAINEVACMAQMPSRGARVGDEGPMYWHLERTVSAAALLIASVCPVPASERDPFTRFDEPEDEKASLRQCQPLMERLVTIVGGPLCSTLMVADNLEIIAHACRALSKLSDTNKTIQMLIDLHDIVKTIVRLGPKAPAVLPPAKRGGHEENQDAHRKRSTSHSHRKPIHCKNGKLKDCVGDDDATVDTHENPHHDVGDDQQLPRPTSTRGGRRSGGRPLGVGPEEVMVGPRNQDSVRGGRGIGQDIDSGQDSGKVDKDHQQQHQSSWTIGGYHIFEREVGDASTRKLCSLPFDYFRLVANVARVPSGRALVQSSGVLKRCLERLALDVGGSAAAHVATLRCRGEICILIGRMAGTHDRESGAANDFILSPRYRALEVIVAIMLMGGSNPCERVHSRGKGTLIALARHHAAFALAELCRDTLRSVPLVAEAGGIVAACKLAKDPTAPRPLLKQVLLTLKSVASFPDGAYASLMSSPGILGALNRIANNSYPSFRPADTNTTSDSSPVNQKAVIKPSASKRSSVSPVESLEGVKITQAEFFAMPSAFGPPKPNSPQARAISELAREVAYLIGYGRDRSAPPPGSSPTKGRQTYVEQPGDSSTTGQQIEKEFWRGKGTFNVGTRRSEDNKLGPEQNNIHKEINPAARSEDTGENRKSDRTVDGMQTVCVPETPGKVVKSVGSGRAGTYLRCGVTSCSGLGFSGEHGGVDGNVQHAPFVFKKVDDQDEGAVKNVGEVCLGGKGTLRLQDGAVDDDATKPAHHPTLATPLTQTSVGECSFREELMKRKKKYGLGRTGVTAANGLDESHLSRTRTSPPTILNQQPQWRRQRSALRNEYGKRGEAPTAVYVDATQNPLIASTRPPGEHPRIASRGLNSQEIAAPLLAHANEPNHQHGSRNADKDNVAAATQNFVIFARPAVHSNLTASVGRRTAAGNSPGRVPARKKLHMNDGSSENRPTAAVVGRFACRAYLLDPTFSDHNVIISHPRLPRISVGGFDQIPGGSTLTDLVASQEEKGAGGDLACAEGMEPYRNSVEVLHHHVSVSGARKACKKRFFDLEGRPLGPVNFHHVYDYTERRNVKYCGRHIVPFP